jgi:hypothetical protein
MSTTYEQHHLGRFVPPMAEDDFKRLCADIAAQGLLEEIVLYEGKILDGWSRYRACQHARVEPRFRDFAGDNPVAYVLARNLQRRHLPPVQILRILEAARQALEAEAVARKRAALKQGSQQPSSPVGENFPPRGKVAEQIAALAGVSDRTAKDYHAVQRRGSAELKEAVDRQEVSISDAAQVARSQPPQEQSAAVVRVRAGQATTLRRAMERKAMAPPAVDPLGVPIPDHLAEAFADRSQFKEALRCLSRAAKLVSQIQAGRGAGLLSGSEWEALAGQLAQVRTQLERAEPYAVCPQCLGRGCRPDDNQAQPICRGTGLIGRPPCPEDGE